MKANIFESKLTECDVIILFRDVRDGDMEDTVFLPLIGPNLGDIDFDPELVWRRHRAMVKRTELGKSMLADAIHARPDRLAWFAEDLNIENE